MSKDFPSRVIVATGIPEAVFNEVDDALHQLLKDCEIKGPFQGDTEGFLQFKLTFSSVALAEVAYRQFRYYNLRNYVLTLFPLTQETLIANEDSSRRLSFKNFDKRYTIEEIHECFQRVGEVLYVRLKDHHPGTASNGYVQFFDQESKRSAVTRKAEFLPADVIIILNENFKLFLQPVVKDGPTDEEISQCLCQVRGFKYVERPPHSCYAFAYFDSKENMEVASRIGEITIGTATISISLAAEKKSKVLVSRFNSFTREEDVKYLLSKFGDVKFIKMLEQEQAAMVQFLYSKSATDAINAAKQKDGYYGLEISHYKKPNGGKAK